MRVEPIFIDEPHHPRRGCPVSIQNVAPVMREIHILTLN
jgi:hypothetical protein